MADPTQVVQYQTGLPPETALYGQELLGSTRGLIYDYAKDASGKTIMVDPTTGKPTTDGSGIPQISGFKPYQQYTGDRVAQFTPLQQQAFQMAPSMAFAGSNTLGNAAGMATAAGTTAAPDIVQDYMNPFTSSVVNEMGRLAGRNIQENVLPNLGAASIGSGQFGSQIGRAHV